MDWSCRITIKETLTYPEKEDLQNAKQLLAAMTCTYIQCARFRQNMFPFQALIKLSSVRLSAQIIITEQGFMEIPQLSATHCLATAKRQ